MGENFRFGKGARGTPSFLRSHDEFETRVVPLVEVEGETVSSTPDPRPGGGGRGGGGGRVPRRAVPVRGRGGARATSAAATLGMPTANLVPDDRLRLPGPRRLRRLGARPPGGGERRGAPDLRDRPRPAGGGVPDRLRGRPLRRRRCGSRSWSGCGARSGSSRWTSWWSRCSATWSERARSASAATVSAPMTLTVETRSARSSRKHGRGRRRHRLHRGPGRAAHRAHQRAHRAPARAQEGPPLAPRAADAGRQAPPAAEVPPEPATSTATAALIQELGLRR